MSSPEFLLRPEIRSLRSSRGLTRGRLCHFREQLLKRRYVERRGTPPINVGEAVLARKLAGHVGLTRSPKHTLVPCQRRNRAPGVLRTFRFLQVWDFTPLVFSNLECAEHTL